MRGLKLNCIGRGQHSTFNTQSDGLETNCVNIFHLPTLPYLFQDKTATKDFEPYKCYTYLETLESQFFNGKTRKKYWFKLNMLNFEYEPTI